MRERVLCRCPNGRVLTLKYDVEREFPLPRPPGVEAVYLAGGEWLVSAWDILGRRGIEWRIAGRAAAVCLGRCLANSYGVEFLGCFE